MRLTKAMKKAFSIVLAGAMVITGINVGAAKADAEEEVVAIIESSANGWQPADETVNATIDTAATEAKTYTVSATYNTAQKISEYLAVRIKSFDAVSSTVEFSNVKVWLDGKGVKVEPNSGKDGDCRIEIANTFGSTPVPDTLNNTFNKIEIEFDLKIVPEGTVNTGSNAAISVGEVSDKVDTPTDTPAPTDASAAPDASATPDASTTPDASAAPDASAVPEAPTNTPAASEIKASIGTDANNWGAADETVTATIDAAATEAKTYTVSNTYNTAQKVSDYLAVRIESLDAVSSTVEFSDVSVWLNGHAIAVTPNYGGDGDCRIELVNNWGKTPISDSFKDVYFNKIEVQFTLKFVAEGTVDTKNNVAITTVLGADKADATDLPSAPGADVPATPAPGPSDTENVWAKKGLHAYIGYQMDGTWDYRNAYEPGKTHDDATSYDYIKAGDDVTYTAKVNDALLESDGEYTISLAGIDLSGSNFFNMLFVSTDIERAAYPDVEVSKATVKIDGKVVDGLEDIVLPYKNTANDKYYTFAISSKYTDWVLTSDIKYWGEDNALEVVPTDSIEVTFTIKGLGNKVENDPVGLVKGKKFTKGNFVYKVTKQAKLRTKGTVSVVGLSKAGKKAKSLTVASTVKNTGTYNVTAIDKSVFKGAAATSVTLNKKIKSIPASAFANCKKLTTLNLKAKLTSVKKGAFKGCTKTITVKGTSKKANIKTLKKSGYKNFK